MPPATQDKAGAFNSKEPQIKEYNTVVARARKMALLLYFKFFPKAPRRTQPRQPDRLADRMM